MYFTWKLASNWLYESPGKFSRIIIIIIWVDPIAATTIGSLLNEFQKEAQK